MLDAGSFREVGALAGRGRYENDRLVEFTPSNFVLGTGRVHGRKVVVGGDDFTVRGGAQDGAIGNKMGRGELMALEGQLPLIRLVDGTGGGGSVKTLETLRATYVPTLPGLQTSVDLMSVAPVVAGGVGVGGWAWRDARGRRPFSCHGSRQFPGLRGWSAGC